MALRPLFFVFLAVTALVTALSCRNVPSKTCSGEKVNALDASRAISNACDTCMQTSCCDLVGACDDDPDHCAKNFKAAQSCTIDGGAKAEPTCKAELKDSLSRQLYSCMRPSCGDKCGIPSCDLDQAVTLFGSAACDKCIGGSCCKPVNDCYKNRNCKLFLECITQHCPRTLGSSMTTTSLLSKDQMATATAIICGDAGAGPLDESLNPGACLDRCLGEFVPNGPTATDDEKAGACLAFGVYTCGASAGCGPDCTGDGGAIIGPYPEDDPDSGR